MLKDLHSLAILISLGNLKMPWTSLKWLRVKFFYHQIALFPQDSDSTGADSNDAKTMAGSGKNGKKHSGRHGDEDGEHGKNGGKEKKGSDDDTAGEEDEDAGGRIRVPNFSGVFFLGMCCLIWWSLLFLLVLGMTLRVFDFRYMNEYTHSVDLLHIDRGLLTCECFLKVQFVVP